MTAQIISIISISIIFLATTLGSAFVFFFKKGFGTKVNDFVLGFAGGIMIAASFFGLILPSINQSKTIDVYQGRNFVPPIVGFIVGGLLLWGMDKLIPHTHLSNNVDEGRGHQNTPRNLKFFLAVTIHNIPEGLSVGFACGLALASKDNQMALAYSALSLAIGIAIQNIPEGAAVSVPLFGEGETKGKSFLFGTLSGVVEPIFAIAGLFLAQLSIITPWLLAVAAGAMFYVTLDEIMPEARKTADAHIGIWSFMIGFVIMMALELAFD
ncbi:MAG: ZIP family metal transporter [Bacilli bacterium]|jgi:ZIP family zinc transporter